MRMACLQHVPFEGPACIQAWAQSRGHSFSIARIYAGDPVPTAATFDWLVIMGGPMSVHDETKLDWMTPEKELVACAIERSKLMLGICLGAQIIADVLGSRVYRNSHKEIGWFPVSKTETAAGWHGAAAVPGTCAAFHWHGETFDIPEGATHWLRSEACANQAFTFHDRIVGLQCHFEMTPAGVRHLIENCGDDLDAGPFVQTPAALLSDDRTFESANITMNALLDRMELIGIESERKST